MVLWLFGLIRRCSGCRRHAGALGRPARFSDSAIELCLTLKALFNLPLRQATGLVASLLKLADLDWPVPDYTTLCRRQKTLPAMLGGRPSSGGLHLLVDSTGIKMMGEGEWSEQRSRSGGPASTRTRKHGASYRRQWRKVHIGIDAETLDIRAIEVTTNAIGDAPKSAMPRSPNAMPRLSFQFAAMDDHGRRMAPARLPAMKRSVRSSGLDAPSGRSGAAITAAASLKPRCIASSSSVSASRPAPSTVR